MTHFYSLKTADKKLFCYEPMSQVSLHRSDAWQPMCQNSPVAKQNVAPACGQPKGVCTGSSLLFRLNNES